MPARLVQWWPAAVLAALVVAAAASVIVAITSYPRMFDDPNAAFWAVLLVAVLGLYGAAAAWALVHGGSPPPAWSPARGDGIAYRCLGWAGQWRGPCDRHGRHPDQQPWPARARADYQRELAASGMTDMATYLAADAVAASVTHMIINLGLGVLGAAIGWITMSASPQRPPV